MAIGASYTGVRAMTGTSGGGYALMVEAVGLSSMLEYLRYDGRPMASEDIVKNFKEVK